jgi:uncharacterized protein (DUF305 family)
MPVSPVQEGPVRASFAAVAASLAIAVTACAHSPGSGAAEVRSTGGSHPPYSAADVSFVSAMIAHHAQALVMADWAPTHGASPAVLTLCERIEVSQRDEIAFMQRWLRERGEPVPEADPSHDMSDMHHSTLMPGMLTDEQLARLDAARDAEFDRLFLTFMIQHHQGAITMVEQRMYDEGAIQDDTIFRMLSDIQADQTAEIDRMTRMLTALPAAGM